MPDPKPCCFDHRDPEPGPPKASCSCSARGPHKWTARWSSILETGSSGRPFKSMLKQSKEHEAASFSLIASLPPASDVGSTPSECLNLTPSRHTGDEVRSLECTNNQDFRFALIWSEIASLYELVGAVNRLHLSDGSASDRHQHTNTDECGRGAWVN